MLRKLFLVLILGINSTAALAISNAELFNYAQANYPSIFSGTVSAGTYLKYTYQYYQGSGNYLAVDNNNKIFMKGPFTHDAISEVGAVADYQNAFRMFINKIGPQGPVGPVGPRGPRGPAGPAGPAGTKAGDMQYWNGTAWVMIPAGIQNSTLKTCTGVPTWTSSTCGGIQIGSRGPGGGIVFYVGATGKHGLEAAPADLASAPWGCSGLVLNRETEADLGKGRKNTAFILDECKDLGIAAESANNYIPNAGWYLPSKDELDLLHHQKAFLTGVTGVTGLTGAYWSSTEGLFNNPIQAWAQNFDTGVQSSTLRTDTFKVRPIRSF